MAIKIADEYPNATPPDGDYPGGSFKNSSTGAATDGTPGEKKWANDWLGFFSAIIAASGIVPSGVPDTAVISQYLQALRVLFVRADGGNQTIAGVKTFSESVKVTDTVGYAELRKNGDIMSSTSATEGRIIFGDTGNRALKVLAGSYYFMRSAVASLIRDDSNTFHGRVDSAGGSIRLPTGWTSNQPAGDIIEVVHNLGHQAYTVVPSVLGVAGAVALEWQPIDNTKFRIYPPSAVAVSFVMLCDS